MELPVPFWLIILKFFSLDTEDKAKAGKTIWFDLVYSLQKTPQTLKVFPEWMLFFFQESNQIIEMPKEEVE